MANVSRVATITFSGGTGSRSWVATADQQDRAAGTSYTITVVQTTGGLTPPGQANDLVLSVRRTDGSLQQAWSLNPASASQSVTFTPATTGTFMLDIRATRTDLGTYDYETDGAPATAPAGSPATQIDRGWIRTTTTADVVLNRATEYAYPDAITATVTLGASPVLSRNTTLTLGPASATTASGTSAAHTHSLGVGDNRFPAAATAYTTALTFANEAATGQPWTTATVTEDSITVDPRLRRRPLFQLDDNAFATPPSASNVGTHIRLSTQQGFLADRLINARDEGVNGITHTVTLTPQKPGTTLSASGLVTQAQGGQDGWSPSFLAWASALPGGTWTKALTVTAPANITGASYMSLAAGESDIHSLVALDPDIAILAFAGSTTVPEGHFAPGQGFAVAGYLISTASLVLLEADTTESVLQTTCVISRSVAGTGLQTLSADGITWVNVASGIQTIPLTDLGGFTYGVIFSGAQTTDWSKSADLQIRIRIVRQGAIYTQQVSREMVHDINSHAKYAFDPTGLFK